MIADASVAQAVNKVIRHLSERTQLRIWTRSSDGMTRVIVDSSWKDPLALWPHIARAVVFEAGVRGVNQVPGIRRGNGADVLVGHSYLVRISRRANVLPLADSSRGLLGKQIGKTARVIVFGGPSGAGKTTLINGLQQYFRSCMYRLPVYTNRPRRPEEVEGQEYYFSQLSLDQVRANPRYSETSTARGYNYWSDLTTEMTMLFQRCAHLYVSVRSHRRAIESCRQLFPGMLFIWVDAKPSDIADRLRRRGDQNVEASLQFNRELSAAELADCHLESRNGAQHRILRAVVRLIERHQGERGWRAC